jgi:hypothetical protein
VGLEDLKALIWIIYGVEPTPLAVQKAIRVSALH